MNNILNLNGVSVGYRGKTILNGIDLQVFEQEILCILGTSGAGKTTLLKAISGLASVNQGDIIFNGQLVSDSGYLMPPQQRKMGLIFQDYALFPHMTVMENIKFSGASSPQEIDALLKTLGLNGLQARYPHELSGGQQQRLAIARAMAYKPRLLMMDEPFSNIDQQTRWPLIEELLDVFKREKMSVILVTHSIEEAFYLGDRVAILDGGCVRQCDVPEVLYRQPVDKWVGDFLALGTVLPVTVGANGQLETVFGPLDLGADDIGARQLKGLNVFITPDNLLVNLSNSGFTIKTKRRNTQGIMYSLQHGKHRTHLFLPVSYDFPIGARIDIKIKVHKPWFVE